ncbi:MAG: DUF3426 domain-containing protein [Curvibacter sp.]|nr:DUF3426 domain-containing protein [Curvibacter sp.]
MSLITRCPACATTYKVVPDQLRISEGWVRCGQCTEVFDARAHLVDEGQAPFPAQPPVPVRPEPAEPPPVMSTAAPEPPAFLKAAAPAPKSLPEKAPEAARTAPRPADSTPPPPPSSDELLAQQLASLDLDVVATPPARAAGRPPLQEPPRRHDRAEGDPDLPVGERGFHAPEPSLLEFPEPGQPSAAEHPGAVRPHALAVPASFDVDDFDFGQDMAPTQPGELEPGIELSLPSSPEPASAVREEPVLLDDEAVPAALLSESAAAELPGDLSGQWVQEPPPRAVPPVAAPGSAPASKTRNDEADGADDTDEINGLLFLRQARRRAFWRKPWVRLLLALVLLLLAGALLLQVAYRERDRLAALEPRLKPVLTALCEPLACSLAPLRRIEAVQIDSSSFNKSRGEAYQLALTLRNTARLPLAMPAAELTLTDSQDHVVLRRVLLPAEIGAPDVLAPGADWSANLPVAVAGAAGLKIAGYRVLVFYP